MWRCLVVLFLYCVDERLSTVEGLTCEDQKPPHGVPKVQLRTILIRCPFRSKYNTYKNHGESPDVALSRGKEILDFYGFDVDEPLLHSEVVHCKRKFIITIKFKNCGRFKKESEYVVVEHAYDPATSEKVRLLNPIVLKITQNPVMQSYPMRLVHVVNGEATETVINKENAPGFRGCSTHPSSPTCGLAYFNGKPLQYSEGFCCSCDAFENLKRQPVGLSPVVPKADIAFSLESGAIPQPLNLKQNLSYVKIQKRRAKRLYPIFPKNYYEIPPLEPAKGFLRSDVKTVGGIPKMDPWEPMPLRNFYWKEYNKWLATTTSPIYHILFKRMAQNNNSMNSSDHAQTIKVLQSKLLEIKNSTSGGDKGPMSKLHDIIEKAKTGSETKADTTKKTPEGDPGQKEGGERRRKKRQVNMSGTQVRGGQNCIDRSTPENADHITYHESAHCLRFSDLWYNVYQIKKPFLTHTVEFEIFEKHCVEDVHNHQWIMKTSEFAFGLGTWARRLMNKDTSIVFSYTPMNAINPDFMCLAAERVLVLVPRDLPKNKLEEFPQPTEPAGHYLLIDPGEVIYDGDECDKIGVSYSAFAKQPNRCDKPRGTCLRNQPLHYYRHDLELKLRGERGSYFLENYARTPDNAIRVASKREFLQVHYEGEFSSVVEIEYKADGNGILRKESTAQITSIYVDSTCEFHTRITVVVTNNGLTSSLFRPRMAKCPVSIPTVWSKQEGPLVAIAPNRNHIFRLSLYGPVTTPRFHCSIELLNRERKVIAVRRVKIQKYDRCFCCWHCLCACLGSIDSLTCSPMSQEHFHAAGFFGSMAVDTSVFAQDDTSFNFIVTLGRVVALIMAVHGFLLLFGLIKAIIGLLCSRKVAVMFLDLVCPMAVEDFKGSENAEKSEKGILRTEEFFYNLICFLVAPGWVILHGILDGCKRCLSRKSEKRTKSSSSGQSRAESPKKSTPDSRKSSQRTTRKSI